MDSWSRGGRGRGNRGRGRGDYNNSYNSNYSNNNGGGDSGGGILSRLGPMADGNSGFSTNNFHQQQQQQPQQGRGRGGYQNSNNNFDHNNSNSSYQQQGRGRGGYQNNNFDQNNSNSNYQQSPRGGRNQTFSSRGRGRGGRGGNNQGGRDQQFTRDLADDDIDMGHDIPADAPVIMVSGYPPEGERTLLNFLHRKSKAAWEELNVQHQGGVTYITVDTPATAENLLRKNGFTYMNAILSITLADGSTPSLPMRQNRNQRPNQQQGNRSNSALAQFLQERWYPEQGYLNLDDLPPTSHSITLVISKLLNEANINYGNAVVTISFARNKLWSFQPLNKLPLIFPDLQNLSLQENDINKFKGIDSLSNKNLPRLTELVLLGNPIQIETPPDVYIREVTQRFPSLLQLDFQPVSQSNGGAFLSGPRMGNDGALPFPIKTSFFDQDNSRQAAQDLLSKFFPLFDSNRSALSDLYDSQSTFSLNVSPSCYAKTTWGQGQRLTIGSDNISRRFTLFPPTIHDLTRAEHFVTDAWQTPGSSTHPVLLFLTVHGSFREASGEVSFDRVFLIAPAAPGSRSQVAGWQYVILSDSMIIRNHSFLPTSQPTS